MMDKVAELPGLNTKEMSVHINPAGSLLLLSNLNSLAHYGPSKIINGKTGDLVQCCQIVLYCD